MPISFFCRALVLCFLFSFWIHSGEELAIGPEENTEEKINLSEVSSAIDRAIDYIIRHTKPSGQFIYIAYPMENGESVTVPNPDAYNMLRHAGTVYALAEGLAREQLIRRGEDTPSGRERRLRSVYQDASRYLRSGLGRVRGTRNALALWEEKRTGLPAAIDNMEREAKLGGAGLTLLAVARGELIEEGLSGFTMDELRGLCYFIRSLQRQNGSFVSKVDANADPDDFESLYYPGEAAMGLGWFARLEPDPEKAALWRETALKTILYLAKSRKGQETVLPDHWALLATRVILEDWQWYKGSLEDQQLLLTHALQIVGQFFSEEIHNGPMKGNFREDGILCPASIRLEGLTAARIFFAHPDAQPLCALIDKTINNTVDLLLRTQISAAEGGAFTDGGWPRASEPMPIETEENFLAKLLLGGINVAGRGLQEEQVREALLGAARQEVNRVERFNRRVREIRIDYVQHAACALMTYELLLLLFQYERGYEDE